MKKYSDLFLAYQLKSNKKKNEKGAVEINFMDFVVEKRNYYIHLMEASGIIGEFGSEIVRSCFYNFEEEEL